MLAVLAAAGGRVPGGMVWQYTPDGRYVSVMLPSPIPDDSWTRSIQQTGGQASDGSVSGDAGATRNAKQTEGGDPSRITVRETEPSAPLRDASQRGGSGISPVSCIGGGIALPNDVQARINALSCVGRIDRAI
ncbi:hypothetical protein [Burkholderia sp. BCC1977]|uniref:hypothetical protein n=1 Tax=Burkholderia sp. BCC1977 TaxID=2817440 RepID=UPI002ABD8CB7|nr:hypothetical protein [Burkholderia sp. BCC1977]